MPNSKSTHNVEHTAIGFIELFGCVSADEASKRKTSVK
jgi:hypothetical protein